MKRPLVPSLALLALLLPLLHLLFPPGHGLHLPEFRGTPLEELFPGYIEPFVAGMRASMSR